MLTHLLASRGIAHEPIALGILYRGAPATIAKPEETEADLALRERAWETFGTRAGLLELIDPPDAYVSAVHDLVLGEHSTARRVLGVTFEEIPFHLTYKCDGCLFNEFCMKQAAETDDLSLLPHITDQEKSVLKREGVTTVRELALLKHLHQKGEVQVNGETRTDTVLEATIVDEELTRRLAATWPVGPSLDELIHRAKRYRRWIGDDIESLSYIPSKGYGSLPHSDATQNPNLVRIYLDAQHDYLQDRLALVGALVVGSERGVEPPSRRRAIVRLSDGQPESDARETELLVDWVRDILQAIVEVAAPDQEGRPRAPIHLIFMNEYAQRVLLAALGRHATSILGATALYDFVTQIAAFDSPLISYLDQQIKEQKNYPMVCQSLQAVAAFLKFDWQQPIDYRTIFRARMFDFWGRFDEPIVDEDRSTRWYTSRARFNSQIPLEFAYAAWGELPPPSDTGNDPMADFRNVTREHLIGFQGRRLEAMEHIARDFRGNRQTSQTVFDLPDLATFSGKAPTFAHALDEFVTIERHVDLAAWKRARMAPPEERVLAGNALIVRYVESDQEPEIRERNRENLRNAQIAETFLQALRTKHPHATERDLTAQQRERTKIDMNGMEVRLRIELADVPIGLDEALALTTLKTGDRLVLSQRYEVDSRKPLHERVRFTPTAKQLLYKMRVDLKRIRVTERDAEGRALVAIADVTIAGFSGGRGGRGFYFSGHAFPLKPGERERYTLDPDPNDFPGYWSSKVVGGLIDGGENALFQELTQEERPAPTWSPASASAQRRFLAGLDVLHDRGALHDFEQGKRDFIGAHGDTPLLLVQGPPGTGKSYTTAFALLARLQGAMAEGRDFRIFVSCKTHAATDVVLTNLRDAIRELRAFGEAHPDVIGPLIDPGLFAVPIFRLDPRSEPDDGIVALPRKAHLEKGEAQAVERISAATWCVVGGTPGGMYRTITDRWTAKSLFGHPLADLLVLDEASQMSIPEAIMAALPLAPDGRVIVVGDHRQMPPIVKNDWARETRRTFTEFRSYESLFESLLAQTPPTIRFEESFRLHADMADFLRREIYAQDGIDYHSRRRDVIPAPRRPITDPLVQAALRPEHPLTVIVHDEAQSQVRNRFEQELIAPILRELAAAEAYAYDPDDGLGVVVPHRAQRAALQEGIPELTRLDPETGEVLVSAVDTVERFQGDERTVILVGTTESDRDYLLVSGKFLLDPRRLTVALSRAKRKMILVAARSVFEIFSADEETFQHAQLWKNLLRSTCTVPLWRGEREGIGVEVWGNPPSSEA